MNTIFFNDSEKDGNLRLEFKMESKSSKGWMILSSASINTDCKFQQKFGFFEARIRIVRPDAKQSAFWLMPNGGTFSNQFDTGLLVFLN